MSSVLPVQSDSSKFRKFPKGVRGAWQGGHCPECGDEMPANLIHCQSCRALLNTELTEDSVEIPQFVPLQEIDPTRIVSARGHFVACPGCSNELRVNRKYRNRKVVCRYCQQKFTYDNSVTIKAIYADCPNCTEELRASTKYTGQSVSCRFCSGPLMLTD